jgi:hypothetical protein
MKKLISFLMIGGLLIQFYSPVKAQGKVAAATLSPAEKVIVENVKNELGLNPVQAGRFTTDYAAFLNSNETNLRNNANNPKMRDEVTKKLLMGAGAKFRSYLNEDQMSKLTAMIQAGKLNPAAPSAPAQPVSKAALMKAAPMPAAVVTQSNVAGLFEQLSPYIKVTADQSAKVMPVLKEYDTKVSAIKTANAGNQPKINSELSAQNSQTMAKLRPILNNDQLQKLVAAATMQENVLSGKNLSMEQRAFLDKLRSQYKLNDVQLMSVILIMVEGKVRGDMIHQAAKTNPQAAATELGNLLQDLDLKLKNSLSAEQYTSVKSDLEKLMKGQKI